MDTNWNENNLSMPSLKTAPASNFAFARHVRQIIHKSLTQNKTLQADLCSNAALLSRLMARRKNSFRSMYGFKCVCKLNTALSRLLKVGLDKAVSNLFQMLPEVTTNTTDSQELPTRNFYDYILLRIIATHKLYKRIYLYCMESADYFEKLLTSNFFLETNILFIAVIAKLWNLSNNLGNFYAGFYKKLYQYRNCFPQTKAMNDYVNFEFPHHLDYISESTKIKSTEHKELDSIQKDSVVSFAPSSSDKIEDIGTAVRRDTLKPVIDLSRVHNIEDIRRFFKEENENRKYAPNTCATKYILKHEWLNIQKMVERKIIANYHKKALSVFRKFMTSKM